MTWKNSKEVSLLSEEKQKFKKVTYVLSLKKQKNIMSSTENNKLNLQISDAFNYTPFPYSH